MSHLLLLQILLGGNITILNLIIRFSFYEFIDYLLEINSDDPSYLRFLNNVMETKNSYGIKDLNLIELLLEIGVDYRGARTSNLYHYHSK